MPAPPAVACGAYARDDHHYGAGSSRLFIAGTVTGLILAVEWWHWRWALYGLLTAVFAAVAVHTWPARQTPTECPWCGARGPATPP